MRIIIAPDSFKGSLSAMQAAKAMERGAKRAFRDATIECLPVADGGEGTVEVIASTTPGEKHGVWVRDPLGRRIQAEYFITHRGLAIIEMAQASGLTLLSPEERDVLHASTYGTGELIVDALSRGCREILLTVGGSATNDGGQGMAKALGLRLLDKAGEPIGEGCAALADLHRVDATSLHPALRETRIRIACDVNNPLCGQQGASAIYSPQKGATPWMVEYMEALLGAYAERLAQDSGAMVAHLPGSGAAGGIGVPLLSYAGASLVSGIDQVLSIMEFDERARHADLVLSGEGSIDAQTPCGKVICGLLERTPDGVPLIAFAGRLAAGYQILYERGLSSCFCILPQAMPLEQAMDRAKEYLEDAVYRALRLLQICV